MTVNGKTQRNEYKERAHYDYGRQWMETNITGVPEGGKKKYNTCSNNNQR